MCANFRFVFINLFCSAAMRPFRMSTRSAGGTLLGSAGYVNPMERR